MKYYSLGTDIELEQLNNNLSTLKITNGDLTVVGKVTRLNDDEDFTFWDDDHIAVVKQMIYMSLKGSHRYTFIDTTDYSVETKDGDYLSDQEYGSVLPHLIGEELTDEVFSMIRFDVEDTLKKIPAIQTVVINKVDKVNDSIEIEIEATLISSTTTVNMSVTI